MSLGKYDMREKQVNVQLGKGEIIHLNYSGCDDSEDKREVLLPDTRGGPLPPRQ